MSTAVGSRGTAYSADTAGHNGRIACQVLRDSARENRVALSIVVRNDTDGEAAVVAFAFGAHGAAQQRTIVQSIVAQYSDFTTTVELDCLRYGQLPELRVEISGADAQLVLIAPGEIGAPPAERARYPAALPVSSSAAAERSSPPALVPSSAHRIVEIETHGTRPGAHDAYGRDRADDTIVMHAKPRSPSMLPMLALFAAVMFAVAFAVFRPVIARFDLPAKAAAGVAFPIAYRATGIGTATYRIVGPDTAVVASGNLPAGSGTFIVSVPRTADDRAYLVRLEMNGVLGSAFADGYVRVPAAMAHANIASTPAPHAPRVVPAPQIRSLAVDRAMLGGGDTLTVYYDVAATEGSVALVDGASQITYGKSPLSPAAHSTFVMPLVQEPHFLSVIVTAQRGGLTAQSRVGVSVAPQASPSPVASDEPNVDSGVAGQGQVPPPSLTAPLTVRSGAAIPVDIHGGVPGLVMVLNDTDGTELARRTAGSARSRTIFTAPIVTGATRIRLEATYPQGSGSETIVKTIVVVPH